MKEKWIGLIPAAGKGLRLGLPYPKELYPIIRNNRYKPIAQFVVDNLVKAGVSELVFVINETKHQLISYFGDGHRFGCSFSYVVQESGNHQGGSTSTSPGLAHALDSAYHLTASKTVFFGMPDTIMKPDDILMQTLSLSNPEDDIVLAVFTATRPEKLGMVRLDRDSRVLEVVDKPKKTNLTKTWGSIIWRPVFTEFLHECVNRKGMSDFAEILNLAIKSKLGIRGVHIPGGSYHDLGTYDEIIELDNRFRDQ